MNQQVSTANEESLWGNQKHLIKQAIPLLLLFIGNTIHQESSFIFLLVVMILVMEQTNSIILKQSCSDRKSSNPLVLLILSLYLLLVLFFIIPLLKMHWCFNQLFEFSNYQKTLSKVVFDVTVMDFALKFFTTLLKCIFLSIYIPLNMDRFKQGGILNLIETFSIFVRFLMPAPEWFMYSIFTFGATSFWALFCALFYLAIKCYLTKSRFDLLFHALQNISPKTYMFTSLPSDDLDTTCPLKCALCHLSLINPVQLSSCGHIFCKKCAILWFDHDSSCPVCSAVYVHSMLLGKTPVRSPIPLCNIQTKRRSGVCNNIVQIF